jgi:nucleotide-binding universal stress UspA family protein
VEAIVKILYATDGGSPAMQALALLARVAAPDKSHVTVVTVCRAVKAMVDVDDLGPDELLPSAVARLQQAGVADHRLLNGHPATAILDEIIDGGFELTVLGAGNRSRLGRLLHGEC